MEDRFTEYLKKTNMEQKEYQYEGVKWCFRNETIENPLYGVRGGILADEMGLGKTIIMIGLMYCNFVKRTLIVLPPVLIDQWYQKIYQTTGHKACLYYGKNKKHITLESILKCPIVITSYNTLAYKENKNKKNKVCVDENRLLHKVYWNRIIFDEAHYLRNCGTSRYFAAASLKKNICWLVSGTPVQNRRKDFYNLCYILNLFALKTPIIRAFHQRKVTLPCALKMHKGVKIPSFQAEQLSIIKNYFILRRTKAEVGLDMQPLYVNTHKCKWDNSETGLALDIHSALTSSKLHQYENISNEMSHSLHYECSLPYIMLARQISTYPKMLSTKLDKLYSKHLLNKFTYDEYKIATNTSSKLDCAVSKIVERKGNGCGKLIFCHFREEIDEIVERMRKENMSVVSFDGRTSQCSRREILRQKYEVMVLHILTGAEGLNLQEHYSEIYFVTPHWNPYIEDQAVARCYRFGQIKPVYVERFIMSGFSEYANSNSIEQHMEKNREKKRELVDEIF
jgi:SNF2 family DNA or RNA helicase